MIRRAGLVLLLGIVALTVASAAGAAYDPAEYEAAVDALAAVDPTIEPAPDDPSNDFVVGAGHNITGMATLAISAHSGALGEDAFGQGTATAAVGTRLIFRVTCLAVVHNLASIGVVVEQGNLRPPGTEVLIFIRDSGLPGGEGDGVSTLAGEGITADQCPAFVAVAAVVPPIEAGNYLVHDAIVP
jgi:hypothetical protein